jgi:acetyl esterase/lipase
VKKIYLIVLVGMMALNMYAQKIRYFDTLGKQLEPDRKVVYKTIGQRSLSLHIFHPEGFKAGDRRPVFVTYHGGGWSGMSAKYFYPYADEFAKHGMVGISVEYRLFNMKQGVTVFDCVKDARSAIRFIRKNAERLGIDPDRIVANGGSAGGHLAASTALFDEINDDQDDLSVSCRPELLVLHYPVIDTSAEGYGQKKIGERWRELSPVDRVKPGLPPTLLLHGTKDTVTPFAGAERFYQAMQAAGNTCEMITHEGGGHGYFLYEKALFDKAMSQTLDFIRRHLRLDDVNAGL